MILRYSILFLYLALSTNGFSQTSGTTASANTKTSNTYRSEPEQLTKEARRYAKKQERVIKREDRKRKRYLKRCSGTQRKCSFDWRDY